MLDRCCVVSPPTVVGRKERGRGAASLRFKSNRKRKGEAARRDRSEGHKGKGRGARIYKHSPPWSNVRTCNFGKRRVYCIKTRTSNIKCVCRRRLYTPHSQTFNTAHSQTSNITASKVQLVHALSCARLVSAFPGRPVADQRKLDNH